MSRISEFEPRMRSRDQQPEVHRRNARLPWPGSAWFAVGTMIVLNLLLLVFIVRSDLRSPRRAHPGINVQKVDPQPNGTPQAPLPVQSLTPGSAEPSGTVAVSPAYGVQAPNYQDRGGTVPHLAANPAMNGPVRESRGFKFGNASKAAVATQRPSVTPRRYSFEPSTQARYASPQITPSRTAAPAPAAAANPTPMSPLPAAVAPYTSVASIHTPTAVVRSNEEERPKVTTSTASENSARKIQPASSSNQKQEVRVASVGLPGMDKGIVVPKTPVGSLNPKIEVVHRPQENTNAAPNCGGAVRIPCPTLKKRASSINPDGDRW